MLKILALFWLHLTGRAAYDRYVKHLKAHHPGAPIPDAASFHRDQTTRKWTGIQRCC
ncbi:MAG: YbdD/YjiX family protein [Alphaproteobacteria bacterium]|nr:YbdD/YjiX family protein [Alphaproteobacteria bacterium]